MKKFLKIFLAVLVCTAILYAFPDEGDEAQDFTIYNYQTESDWTLSDYLDDNTVILLISGSYC